MGLGPSILNRHAATLSFGLGSFLLMGDMAVVVLRNGESGGNIFDMGFPTLIGIIGFCLWGVAIVLIIVLRAGGGHQRSVRSRSVFLRGKDGFTCRACRRYNKVITGEYLKHHRCPCGAEYDLFQDGPWDEDGPIGRSSGGRGGMMRKGTGRDLPSPSRQRDR